MTEPKRWTIPVCPECGKPVTEDDLIVNGLPARGHYHVTAAGGRPEFFAAIWTEVIPAPTCNDLKQGLQPEHQDYACESCGKPLGGMLCSGCQAAGSEHQVEVGGGQAFSGEWRYTFVARDLDDASSKWEALDDAAERLGFNGEGGSVHRMDESELIPGSPTHRQLPATPTQLDQPEAGCD